VAYAGAAKLVGALSSRSWCGSGSTQARARPAVPLSRR